MDVYTLVGKSGTGKSFHAMNLCKKMDIEAIIDDGLFIYRNSVAAGISAKRAGTRIGAIKMALFNDEELRRQVAEAIKEKNPSSILVLGTSDGMVDRIIERLGLPAVEPGDSLRRIRIEDITTDDERTAARQQRDEFGKHVIPAPQKQLKKTFSGYFMDTLRFFRGRDQGAAAERTVVRPSYSYMGEYFIADRVIDDIITCLARLTPAIDRVIYISQNFNAADCRIKLSVKLRKGFPLWESLTEFQRGVEEQISNMTAYNVIRVDIEVRRIK